MSEFNPTYYEKVVESLRHKEAEFAYLKQQKKMVKFEVRALRRILKSLNDETNQKVTPPCK